MIVINSIVQKNTLSFYNDQGVLTIPAKQYDIGRKFVFDIVDDDKPYDLTGCSVYLRMLKADGKQLQCSECCVIDGNLITIDTSITDGNQILVAEGKNICELHLFDNEGNSLTTWDFVIDVCKRVHNGDAMESIDSWDDWDKIKQDVEQIKLKLDNSGFGDVVTGVKGDAETTYRTGQVNITPANIGAVPVGNSVPAYSLGSSGISVTLGNMNITLDNTFDEVYQILRQNNNTFENYFIIHANSNTSQFNYSLPVQSGGLIECIMLRSLPNRCFFKFTNYRNNDTYINAAIDGVLNGWVKLADITDTEVKQVNLRTNIINSFKSSIKGDAVREGFLATFRDNVGVNEGMFKYGAGLAWGIEDTHAYLNIEADTVKKAYIGGGNADKINWFRSIAFEEDCIPKTGGAVTGDLNFVNMKGIQWQESGYGDKFKIVPNFSGADDQNKLLIQSAVGAANTDPTLNTVISIAGKTGDTQFVGNVNAPKYLINNTDINSIFAKATDYRLKTYTGLNQIGLTNGTETINDIGTKLPTGSMLVTQIGADNATIYPEQYGTLIVIHGIARVNFRFQAKQGANTWLGGFADNNGSYAWSGWSKVALASDIDTLKTNFQDGCSKIATAITNNGVTTASNASPDTMATNIATLATNKYNAGVNATKVGTAVAANVLKDKTFTNSSGVGIAGTMNDYSSAKHTLITDTSNKTKSIYRITGTTLQIIPAVGYWGTWDWNTSNLNISASTLGITAAKILKGNTICGVAGTGATYDEGNLAARNSVATALTNAGVSTASGASITDITNNINALAATYGRFYDIMKFMVEKGHGTDLITNNSGDNIIIVKKGATKDVSFKLSTAMNKYVGVQNSDGTQFRPPIGSAMKQGSYDVYHNEYKGFFDRDGQFINVWFNRSWNGTEPITGTITGVKQGMEIFSLTLKRTDTSAWVTKWVYVLVI